MYVTINGTNSRLKQIKAGVPQELTLGPILYNIFTNDIPTSNKTYLAIYADDTAIYASSWNPRQSSRYIQDYLEQILDFLKKLETRRL